MQTKEQKEATVSQLQAQLETQNTVYVTNYSGLTVAQIQEVRKRFREAGVDYKVVKNTLLRRAMEQLGGFDDLFESLNGPTAVAITDEPAAPARVIKSYIEDTKSEKLQLKSAYIDGAVFDGAQLDALASLKSKNELIGDILGLLMSPAANVIGALQAPGTTIAGAIKQIGAGEGQ